MSVVATAKFQMSVAETLPDADLAANAKVVTHSGYDQTYTLNGGSTPPATKSAFFSKALSAGAGTIDLTALPSTNGATVDGTSLKVQLARFRNPPSNANAITVTFGASNGYLLAGTAWKVILSPGQCVQFYGNDATPDVDSTHKNIDIAGTASQALEVSLVLG